MSSVLRASAKSSTRKSPPGGPLRQQRKAKGSKNRKYQYREAVLRHLIRTIFAWILKEDGKLPPAPFDEAFARREAPGSYHKDILTFLFHQRLNRAEGDREDHPNPQINEAMQDTRFLNGSLFALHEGDNLLEISDDDYCRRWGRTRTLHDSRRVTSGRHRNTPPRVANKPLIPRF